MARVTEFGDGDPHLWPVSIHGQVPVWPTSGHVPKEKKLEKLILKNAIIIHFSTGHVRVFLPKLIGKIKLTNF